MDLRPRANRRNRRNRQHRRDVHEPVSGGINPLNFLATLVPNGDLHKVKILQQDTITTTHNKQATFSVTEQKPVLTGTTGVPLASVGPTARSRPRPP